MEKKFFLGLSQGFCAVAFISTIITDLSGSKAFVQPITFFIVSAITALQAIAAGGE